MTHSLFQFNSAREKQAAAMRQDAMGSLLLAVATGVGSLVALPTYPMLAACALTFAVFFLSDSWTSMDCARSMSSSQARLGASR